MAIDQRDLLDQVVHRYLAPGVHLDSRISKGVSLSTLDFTRLANTLYSNSALLESFSGLQLQEAAKQEHRN